jgi:uncharacterized lipoprotein YajG
MEQSAKRPKKLLSLIVLAGLMILAACTPTTTPSSEVPRVKAVHDLRSTWSSLQGQVIQLAGTGRPYTTFSSNASY